MSTTENQSNLKLNIYVRTRIKLRSYCPELLDIACDDLAIGIKKIDGRILGPMRLPTKKRGYCLLTSPHVYKTAREHFRLEKYQRFVDIYTPKILMDKIQSFLTIPIPKGVDPEIV